MFSKSSVRFSLIAFLSAVYFRLETCSAATSPATKLISGIWTEEGCIVPQDDKSRKIWGVATIWLMDDPVEPCNSPCGCPPEGLNPPFVVKPSDSQNVLPVMVGPIQPPPSLNKVPSPPPVRYPPFVGGIPPGCIPAPPGFGLKAPLPPPRPIVPPFVGPFLPPPVAPPFIGPPQFVGPPPPHFVGPLPPHFVGPPLFPPPVPVQPPPPRIPFVPPPFEKPIFEQVPIDFGFPKVPPVTPVQAPLIGNASVGTTSITTEDHDKTHLNVGFNSDKGSKNTTSSTTGSIATGIPLVIAPPQVAISAGSTTVTNEDWDKEKLNANYDKDTGSKQTVTTTGGTSALVAAPQQPCQLNTSPTVVQTPGTTTTTQEDWDKEKLSANYDKDKGSKQTVTTTGGTSVPVAAPLVQPCLCAGVSQPVVAVPGTSTTTQEDWDKQHMNLNFDKDKGSKKNVTTTLGSGGIFPSPYGPPPPLIYRLPPPPPPVLGPFPHVDIGILLPPPYFPGAFAAIIPPLHPPPPPFVGPSPFPGPPAPGPHAPSQVVGTGASTTVSQEDWDKQKLNANYDKDKGSKQTVTTTGGTSALVAAPSVQPCLCATGKQPVVGGLVAGGATSTVSQEDWDKQNFNLNFNKDTGSKTNVTSTLGSGGGIFQDPYGPPPSLYGHGPVGPPPQFYGPVGPALPGPSSHVDIGVLLPPQHQGPFEAVAPPPHHPPFFAPHQITGPPAPFLQHGGVLPIPPPVPGHAFGPFGPPPPLNPGQVGPPPSLVPHDGFPLQQPQHSVPSHHGLPPLISNLPVIGSILKPIFEHVVIDLGDTPTNVPVPLDNRPNVPQGLPTPSNIGPNNLPPPPPSSEQLTEPPAPGRIPSLISKIPLVGPLLKPYFEPAAANVGDTVAPPSPLPQPLEPTHHTVPYHFGAVPPPQQPTGPFTSSPPPGYGYFLPPPPGNGYFLPPPQFSPAGIPYNAPPPGTPPLSPQYSGSSPFHTVPIDFGNNPSIHNFPPPPSFGPIPSGPPPVPPYLGHFSQGPPPSLGPNPNYPPTELGPLPPLSQFPAQGPSLNPPPVSSQLPFGTVPAPLSPQPSGSSLFHTVPIDFGHNPSIHNLPPPPSLGPVPSRPLPVSDLRPPPPLGPLPQGAPPSLGPIPNRPPSITELGPPPSLGPRPQGPPPDVDFLPKDPSQVVNLRPPTTPIQDPGLVGSKRNKNVLVNKYGGGVALPVSLQPTKCRSGRCNHGRDIKDSETTPTTPENHLHSTERGSAEVTESLVKTVKEEGESSSSAPLQSL